MSPKADAPDTTARREHIKCMRARTRKRTAPAGRRQHQGDRPMRMLSNTEAALDSRARRAARQTGLRAIKGKTHDGTDNDLHGFGVCDAAGTLLTGERFDMTAADVIAYCKPD